MLPIIISYITKKPSPLAQVLTTPRTHTVLVMTVSSAATARHEGYTYLSPCPLGRMPSGNASHPQDLYHLLFVLLKRAPLILRIRPFRRVMTLCNDL